MEKFISVLGFFLMIGICWFWSTDRKKIDWKLVLNGTLLQLAFAFIFLKTTWGQSAFHFVDSFVNNLLAQSRAGAVFLFSSVLGDPEKAAEIFGEGNGFFFAFQALPLIIFVSALTAILYNLHVMQLVVNAMAFLMRKVMRISGAEAVAAAGNVFVGMTEAPLMVRPYLSKMTLSEMNCLIVGGFATIAGSVLGSYVIMLSSYIDGVAAHFVAASVMSAPAAIVFAKIMVPETGTPETMKHRKIATDDSQENVLDACGRGCSEGLKLALNVAGMLIGFLSLVAMCHWLWNAAAGACGVEWLTLQKVISWICSPFAFLLGIPFQDILPCAELIGEKTFMNEFVAYSHFAQMLNGPLAECSERTRVIISYALCGFANIGSIGIVLGGIGSLVPEQRKNISRLALKALVAGTFASFSTAIIAGLLY